MTAGARPWRGFGFRQEILCSKQARVSPGVSAEACQELAGIDEMLSVKNESGRGCSVCDPEVCTTSQSGCLYTKPAGAAARNKMMADTCVAFRGLRRTGRGPCLSRRGGLPRAPLSSQGSLRIAACTVPAVRELSRWLRRRSLHLMSHRPTRAVSGVALHNIGLFIIEKRLVRPQAPAAAPCAASAIRVRYVAWRRGRDADHLIRRSIAWRLLPACHGVLGKARNANRVVSIAHCCVRPLGVSHVRWCKRGLV